MSVITQVLSWLRDIAADDSHGYSQIQRYGPDYDCSSLIIEAFKCHGVPLTCYNTSTMKDDMLRNGFELVEFNQFTGEGLRAGDILLNEIHHTAIYIGGGQVIEANINELGSISGGQPGDQTGKEIWIRPYYRFSKGWDFALRYNEGNGATGDILIPLYPIIKGIEEFPILKYGSNLSDDDDILRTYVRILQLLLVANGYDLPGSGVDGRFGFETKIVVLDFQDDNDLEADGEVGPITWSALIGG